MAVQLIAVRRCARCGGNHDCVEVRPFEPGFLYDFWGSCPETGAPILIFETPEYEDGFVDPCAELKRRVDLWESTHPPMEPG